MCTSTKLNDYLTISQQKLGHGAFGSVYMGTLINPSTTPPANVFVAVKCESKENNKNLTLLREFKICRKMYIVKKYLRLLRDNNETYRSLENTDTIKIYKYITENDLLSVPPEFDINIFIDSTCVPETFSYIECTDYNFLTMQLCGDNIENIINKYSLSEQSKYNIAYKLLYIMSCIHRCGIIHRDIKLSNIVLDEKIENDDEQNMGIRTPIIIDLGLAKEYYKIECGKICQMVPYTIKSITGTLRYISLNIHEYRNPSIIDDLISLCYTLVVIFTEKPLPWISHNKDIGAFDPSRHTETNCFCEYHKNKAEGTTKKHNTIAEVKFHTDINELTLNNKYEFIGKWLIYLYSLKPKQLPSYNYLLKQLKKENNNCSIKTK